MQFEDRDIQTLVMSLVPALTRELWKLQNRQQNKEVDKVMNSDEAAEYLGVSVKYLRNLIQKGRISVINLGTGDKGGGRYKFKKSSLDKWLSDNESGDGLN